MTCMRKTLGKIKPLVWDVQYNRTSFSLWRRQRHKNYLASKTGISRVPKFYSAQYIIRFYHDYIKFSYAGIRIFSYRRHPYRRPTLFISGIIPLNSNYSAAIKYSKAKLAFKKLIHARNERIRVCSEQGILDINSDEANTLIALMSQ